MIKISKLDFWAISPQAFFLIVNICIQEPLPLKIVTAVIILIYTIGIIYCHKQELYEQGLIIDDLVQKLEDKKPVQKVNEKNKADKPVNKFTSLIDLDGNPS